MQFCFRGGPAHLGKQKLAVNPRHPLMRELYRVRNTDPTIARVVVGQVFDNALLAAGLLDDARVMLPRLNLLMNRVLADTPSPTDTAEE